MKLLLPIFAVLGLFLAACSGSETAIEVETEIEETTDQSVEPQTTEPSTEDVEGPVTPTIAPEPPAETVGDAELVGDDEQVVTQTTTPRSTETAVPIPAPVRSSSQEEWNNNYLITKHHEHVTVDGETKSHSHEYIEAASSHYHREGIIIYLTASEDEFVREDVSYSFWPPFGEFKDAPVSCNTDYCSHQGPGAFEVAESTNTKTRSVYDCSPEALARIEQDASLTNDPIGAGCVLESREIIE